MFDAFLWPHPGMEQALVAYEDAVLVLLGEHDGEVLHRGRTDGADGRPLEIHLLEWASQEWRTCTCEKTHPARLGDAWR
jgi:hypothetical protein